MLRGRRRNDKNVAGSEGERREHVLEGRKGTRFRLLGGRSLGGEASALYSTLVAVDAVRARGGGDVCLLDVVTGRVRPI